MLFLIVIRIISQSGTYIQTTFKQPSLESPEFPSWCKDHTVIWIGKKYKLKNINLVILKIIGVLYIKISHEYMIPDNVLVNYRGTYYEQTFINYSFIGKFQY